MKVIHARNVQQALPLALRLLRDFGLPRDSRNGPVLQFPSPVATVYEYPQERVLFWAERDANPFFHLYESLWMLAGRNDVEGPARYAKNMRNYSDDGKTLYGAYGNRWRWADSHEYEDAYIDQLKEIVRMLREDKTDRRAVLEMWSTTRGDLGGKGKDLPCNLTATFQVGPDNRLHLVVFCRSNDIIWGCYGANAVHFSVLLEYMALAIGVPMGTYTQVSVNWHAYQDKMFQINLEPDVIANRDPYQNQQVVSVPMRGHLDAIDEHIHSLLHEADTEFVRGKNYSDPWAQMVYNVLKAHHIYKSDSAFQACIWLKETNEDWVVAARQWLQRRVK